MADNSVSAAAAADPPAPKPATVLDYRSALPPGQPVEITARTLRILQQTGPWALAISLLMLIGGLLIIVTGVLVTATDGHPFPLVVAVSIGLGLVVPSVFLARCANYTREFVRTLDGNLLEKSLESSWMFWKVLALGVVVMVVVIMAAARIMHI